MERVREAVNGDGRLGLQFPIEPNGGGVGKRGQRRRRLHWANVACATEAVK